MDNVHADAVSILNSSTLLFIMIPVLFVIIMVVYLRRVVPFLREKEYIRAEIGRTSGHEQRAWKRRLRRLYVGSIPLVGWILVRFMKHRH